MQKHKICSFFGHRNVVPSEELKSKIKDKVEELINDDNVLTFLFGSRSAFDTLCHLVVSELKNKYPQINRVCFTTKNETCILESEKEKWGEIYLKLHKKEVHLLCYDKEKHHKTRHSAGKASYIERNKAMIDESDYCIFYYDVKYIPQIQKNSIHQVYFQSKSGTAIAYEYAKQKKKAIFNLI